MNGSFPPPPYEEPGEIVDEPGDVNTPLARVESTGSWTFTRRTRARAYTQRPRTWRNADDFRRSDSKLEIRDLGSGAHARRRRVRCRARGVQHHDARKDYVRPMARSSNGCRCWSSYDPHNVFRMNQNVTPAV